MPKKDRLWLGPELNGRRPFVRETADGKAEAGMIGQDSTGADSMLELRHVRGAVYEVEKETKMTAGTGTGPAQVATKAYRDGWAKVFGSKTFGGQKTVGQA